MADLERLNCHRPIDLRDLTVRYGSTTVFEHIDLTVGAGSIYVLLGRNGCGKTSLVRCLLGQQRPAAGGARLAGFDVWRHRRRALERVAVVPERPEVPARMTAAELFLFCRRTYRSWDGDRAEALVRQLELPSHTPFGRLSRGQQTLTTLAAAIACRPDLLVLDDPLLGLDPVARRTFVEELIGELADRGTTVFMTTQQLREVESLADSVGVLHRGRLLVDEPLERLRGRFRRLHLDAGAPREELERLRPLSARPRSWGTEVVVEGADGEELLREHVVRRERLSLEEIFVALVEGPERADAGEGEQRAANHQGVERREVGEGESS